MERDGHRNPSRAFPMRSNRAPDTLVIPAGGIRGGSPFPSTSMSAVPTPYAVCRTYGHAKIDLRLMGRPMFPNETTRMTVKGIFVLAGFRERGGRADQEWLAFLIVSAGVVWSSRWGMGMILPVAIP